jgi:hypothetical protein
MSVELNLKEKQSFCILPRINALLLSEKVTDEEGLTNVLVFKLILKLKNNENETFKIIESWMDRAQNHKNKIQV